MAELKHGRSGGKPKNLLRVKGSEWWYIVLNNPFFFFSMPYCQFLFFNLKSKFFYFSLNPISNIQSSICFLYTIYYLFDFNTCINVNKIPFRITKVDVYLDVTTSMQCWNLATQNTTSFTPNFSMSTWLNILWLASFPNSWRALHWNKHFFIFDRFNLIIQCCKSHCFRELQTSSA